VSKLVLGTDKDGNPRFDKPPLKLSGDRLVGASHSNPADWTTYTDACAIVAHAIDGAEAAGFVFHDSDPYSGVDFDGCRDPETGAIAEWAKVWIDRLNSYTEISVSGTGVKVWVRGKLPKAIIHKLGEHKGIEIYSRQRYFWMTGNRLASTPATINEAQAVLDDMAAELNPPKPVVERKPIERKISKGEQAAEDMALAERYALAREWLLDHYDLVTELKDANAKETRSGYSCPFCTHTHTTTLTIETSGKVGYSHSPNCKLYNRKGFDVTNVLILRGNYRGFDDMARHQAPHCFAKPKPKEEEKRYTVAERREWHQKRAEARAQAKAARVAEVATYTAAIATDERLGERERRVWAAHCTLFADNADHCASVARLAAMVYGVERPEEKHIRAVQRANERLIECGYLERTIRGSEARRETNYWHPRHRVTQTDTPLQDAKNTGRDTLRSRVTESLDKPDLADEARRSPAETLAEWEACEVEPDLRDVLDAVFPLGENQEDAPAEAPVQKGNHIVALCGDRSALQSDIRTQPADRMGLSPKERYTLRRIADGDVLRMERLPEPEADGEQTAFVEPPPVRPPEPTTPRDWARLRYERKRQRRLVRRTGPPVVIAPYRPPTVRSPVDLPAFLTGKLSAMLPAPRSQAPTALSPPLASSEAPPDAAATIASLMRRKAEPSALGAGYD
jgi:hypothetical protein